MNPGALLGPWKLLNSVFSILGDHPQKTRQEKNASILFPINIFWICADRICTSKIHPSKIHPSKIHPSKIHTSKIAYVRREYCFCFTGFWKNHFSTVRQRKMNGNCSVFMSKERWISLFQAFWFLHALKIPILIFFYCFRFPGKVLALANYFLSSCLDGHFF